MKKEKERKKNVAKLYNINEERFFKIKNIS